jgi:DNA (cytosine-5)-methyltransferase 1
MKMEEIINIKREEGWTELPSGLVVPEEYAVKNRRPTCVDLFSGCGGFSLGMIQAGFEVLAGLDNDPVSMLTYLCNLGSYPVQIHFISPEDEVRAEKAIKRHLDMQIGLHTQTSGSGWISGHPEAASVRHFFLGDVRKITGAQILRALGKEIGEVDCVVGGPPCQGFSTAGKRNVMDPRNSLVFEFARLVTEMLPKTMIFENVPGILSMTTPEGLPVVDALCRVLEDGGFGTVDALKRALLASAGCGAAFKHGSSQKKKKPKGKASLPLFEGR